MSYKRKRQARIEALINESINRVVEGISKQVVVEATPGLTITPDELSKMDVNKVSALAQKTNVNVTDQMKEADAEVAPIDAEVPAEAEEQEVERSPQEEAVYNVSNWAHQLNLNIGEGEEGMNQTVKFGYYDDANKQYIAILVFPTGVIKMSGHVVQDFNDFKNIVDFHKDL